MRKSLLIVAAGVMLALSQTASAAPALPLDTALTAPQTTDVAYRRHWRHYRHHRYWGAYNWYGPYYRPYAWHGRYPTARSFYRHGRCVEDLGYGRVELCN